MVTIRGTCSAWLCDIENTILEISEELKVEEQLHQVAYEILDDSSFDLHLEFFFNSDTHIIALFVEKVKLEAQLDVAYFLTDDHIAEVHQTELAIKIFIENKMDEITKYNEFVLSTYTEEATRFSSMIDYWE